MLIIKWKLQDTDACMWGKHNINKVWLHYLSLYEIVQLRDITKTNYQLRVIFFNDYSDQSLSILMFVIQERPCV